MPELAQQLSEACGPGMPGPYREVKKVGCQVGARCGGGVKTPPYEWKIQWQQTQSVRAGHARPLLGGYRKAVGNRQESLRRCGVISL